MNGYQAAVTEARRTVLTALPEGLETTVWNSSFLCQPTVFLSRDPADWTKLRGSCSGGPDLPATAGSQRVCVGQPGESSRRYTSVIGECECTVFFKLEP